VRPVVANALSSLSSLIISGVVGNLAYDLLKKFLHITFARQKTPKISRDVVFADEAHIKKRKATAKK